LLPQEKYPDNHSVEMGLIEKQLAFPNAERFNRTGEIEFVSSEIALSGNVREKHKSAEIAAQSNEEYFAFYRDEVEKVIPKDLLPEEINIRLSSVILDNEYREEFIREIIGDRGRFSKVDILPNGDFKIINGRLGGTYALNQIENGFSFGGNTEFLAKSKRADEILQHILDGSATPFLTDTRADADGKKTTTPNIPAMKMYKQKMNELEDKFKDWIFKDPERTQNVCRKYNDVMNSYVNTEYIHPLRRIDEKAQIRFPNSFFPHPARQHQADAIHRILTTKNTMLAHCVGAGKTYEMITSSMEAKRLGISNKPLHIVPNHMLQQYSNDFQQMYPQAKLLIADEEAVKPAQRQEFFNRMALGNYDAIIIKQSFFLKLSVSPEYEKKFVEEEKYKCEQFLNSYESDDGKKNYSVKDVEKRLEKLEEKLNNITERINADTGNFYFDQMGIDRIYVDEADMFKNLEYVTKMHNIRGLGTASGSQKAFDLYMKTEFLRETNGSIVFATGTPISNSLVEAYTMQRFLQPDLLEQQNIQSLDQWASQWAEVSKDLELNNTGTDYKIADRFAKIVNVPELTTMLRDVWDVKQQDFLIEKGILQRGENIPHLNKKVIAIPSNPLLESYRQHLVERELTIKGKKPEKGGDNVLTIIGDGKNAALDMRLISPIAPNLPFSKLNVAVDYAHKVYRETMKEKGTTAIFFDKGTDHKTDFNAYQTLKEELILKGIPENEIILGSELEDDNKKQDAFDKMNTGEARIIIGSTQRMGAGTNIQERLHTIIHLDIPLRPRDMEQRLGRIDRQGNNWSKVDEVVLVQQGSLDSGLLHLNEIKAGFIGKILSGDDKSRSIEEESFSDMKELSIEDPLLKESMQLKNDIKDLKLQQEVFRNTINVSSREAKVLGDKISQNDTIISALKNYEILPKEPLKYDEKNLQRTLKLEINGKNLTSEKEPFKELRRIVEKELIGKVVSTHTGNNYESLDVRCQNIDFKIQAHGSYASLQSLEVAFNANGQTITNRLNSNASGQTIVDKMLETPNDRIIEKINYLEKQNTNNKSALEVHEKKLEVKEFPHKNDIIVKENRLDVVVKEISERQNIAKVEHEKHLAELKEKGIEIYEIHWEDIEHKTEQEIASNVSVQKEAMINLAGSRLVDGKSMPELTEKNSLENAEKAVLKNQKETPKEQAKPEVKLSEIQKAQMKTGNLFGEDMSEKQAKRRFSATEKANMSREARKEIIKSEQMSLFSSPSIQPQQQNTWIKVNTEKFDKAEFFGDKNDKYNRIYLLTEHGSNETKAIVADKINGRIVLASSNDISIEKMRPLIMQQFDTLIKGEPLKFEKTNENIKTKNETEGVEL